jgi:hypothetical protein
MKLNEMSSSVKSHEQGFSDLCEIFYKDYYDLVEKKCHKVFSTKSYVDKEDIVNEVIYNSVEQHQKIVETSKNHSDLSEDFLIKKSIDRGIWDFIYEDSNLKNTYHFEFGSNRNNTLEQFKAGVVIIEEKYAPKTSQGFSYPLLWRDMIPDDDLEDPLDRLIYQEYVELLISSVEELQNSSESNGLHKKRKNRLMEITTMLLSGSSVKEIKQKLGVGDSCIHYIRKDILFPLALMVIDDPLWYRKYWNSLNKKAKKIIFLKKGVAF